jgi:hypothetical protein
MNEQEEREQELFEKMYDLLWDLDYGFVPEIQIPGAMIELRSLVREWNASDRVKTHPHQKLTWERTVNRLIIEKRVSVSEGH